ncbi:hypothetical protein [Nocardioides okcheonensis]|uniref:hypothetical protein n=1 Tax=Nocardioides okcheonensis TaxID=2894081 RepID=UPI001E3CBC9B|nr:hypothetical protein [Nocardioides okcheonensis]UFN46130.1 hypothetical protein LN652_08005 [Nocardioides okcheonensis]
MRTLGALVVGAVSGAAGTLVHQHWWGLALALVTGLVVVAWLPAGAVRLAFAVGWCVPVVRGALALPSGGFLVAANAPGWSFLAGSGVLLVAALLTLGSAADPGSRGPAS